MHNTFVVIVWEGGIVVSYTSRSVTPGEDARPCLDAHMLMSYNSTSWSPDQMDLRHTSKTQEAMS